MTISSYMKRDGRTFDHQTLEAIRLMAAERVRADEAVAEVIAAHGFNRTTIYKWLKALPRVEAQSAYGAATKTCTPATPPGMRVRTWRFEKLRL